MHQAEVTIEEVKIQHALRPFGKDQSRPLVAMSQLGGATRFLHTQHGDESCNDFVATDDLLNQTFLGKPALLILIGTSGFVRQGFGVLDQLLRALLELFDKIDAADLQSAIDPRIQLSDTVKREVTFEDHAVETRQHTGDQTLELIQKTAGKVHGVLPILMVESDTPSSGLHAVISSTPTQLPATISGLRAKPALS